MIPIPPVVGVDLPEVGECYGHVRKAYGATMPDPFTTCDQCDGRHRHEWVHALVLDKWGVVIGDAWRCRLCGGRRCDVECNERRHHRGPHLSPAGDFRPVGK